MRLLALSYELLSTQSALQSCQGISPQPPPVFIIYWDDATAATAPVCSPHTITGMMRRQPQHQCAHHTLSSI